MFVPTAWLVVFLVLAILGQTKLIPYIASKNSTTVAGMIVTQAGADETLQTALTAVIWVLFAVLGVVPFVRCLLRFLSLNLALTNKRVVGKIGILRIFSIDIPIEKADHCEIKAGIFGNLFHYFSLRIVSVGGSSADRGNFLNKGNRDAFVAISNAQQFKDAVTEAVEQHAAEARRAQAEEIARAMGR